MNTPIKTLVLCSVAAFSFAQVAGATEISFDDSGADEVEILASDLPVDQAVTGYDILVDFDAGVSSIASVDFNDVIYGPGGGFDVTNQGTFGFGGSEAGPFSDPLELDSTSLGPDADALSAQSASPILLATLFLTPSGASASSTDLTVNWTTGGYEVLGVVDPSTGLPTILAPTTTSVPEPAMLTLFGLALAGWGISRRRRPV